ncbi:MAG: tRNA (N(6)-L-threonylcarbamoyladenosine(37)-C(2))-methylthiotransferase MtaB [Verrucomicrobiota bacterium JB024]|nr:tRNA (N(6)-L-threonylcarbamoyladenosine(37)-C(2))-methylthiotransferase MtaB [Verrucomicrobiota bacterium JB024]
MNAHASQTRRPRASLHTLGCRLNQSETLALREKLTEAGYEIVPFGQEADLGIINTCTVTAQADSKCRQTIRNFVKRNPEAFTAVVGCYSQMGAKEVAEIGGVDLIVGNQDKLGVLDYIGDRTKNELPVIVREKIDRRDFTMNFAGERPFNQRANLKVQDGCDFVCSFCIIPFARGRARSRDLADLLREVDSQVSRGVRELVLTGVNIGTYANSEFDILGLVDALDAVDGLDRIRISSIEPTTVPWGLFARMADPEHALLPYLHLPLQSGSDRILKEMRRRYDRAEWADFVQRATEAVPDLFVGTDVMVGFPGETETDFQDTCALLLDNPVAWAHVFTYSEREGTLAARRDDHVPMTERHRRSARLRALAERLRRRWHTEHLGREMRVLFEDPREGIAPGLTDNYVRVVVPMTDPLKVRNRLGRVRLRRVSADFVEGELVEVLG